MDRRTFIAGTATLPVLTAAIAVSQVVDPHRGWLDAWQGFVDRLSAGNVTGETWATKDELEELICATPAQTVDGILAQIEFATCADSGFDIGTSVWKNLDGQLFNNVTISLREHRATH